MRIDSMTATFGKLEHETLTLTPGLNIIEAPNEWGKSTWCAFLVNMLYGIETRAKTTKSALADKERYAPWSGSPMAGRIDLNWNGRDITIERQTRGRLIFGDFRAYETATGVDIPELNGANCGQILLGVERSVFTRAGFLKLSDLPVTQDDSLRRRLNNLVTTGDESGAGGKLEKQLKDLKNKCRYNRSGLLPQAEAERDQLRNQLDGLYALQNKADALRLRQSQQEQRIAALENHRDALRYAESLEDTRRVAEAEEARDLAKEALAWQLARCEALPQREDARQKLAQAETLRERQLALGMEPQPVPPTPPEIPVQYAGLTPEGAVTAAREDFDAQQALEARRRRGAKLPWIYCTMAALMIAAMVTARFAFSLRNPLVYMLGGAAVALLGIGTLIACAIRAKGLRKALDTLYDRHPGLSPDRWISDAEAYAARQTEYTQALTRYQASAQESESRRKALEAAIRDLTGDRPLEECREEWSRVSAAWDALGNARKDLQTAEGHLQSLRSMAKSAEPPKYPDTLTGSLQETEEGLTEARLALRQLQLTLGQCLGQAEALGQESLLKARLDTLNRRITRLEDTYYALEMAQDALHKATTALQRRFAPRISKRAQELFGRLTGGRYQRMTLAEDLSLNASAGDEDTLRSSQWRSDGTVDQLYLALRLAVAEELTPEAPLVLDDALVRFDDQRLAAALEILKEEAQSKQVILFTCQSREAAMRGVENSEWGVRS